VRSLFLPSLTVLLVVPACDVSTICDTGIQPSIVVAVIDSLTGIPLADSAQGLLHDGAFTDTLVPYGYDNAMVLRSLAMRGERPGTYAVNVLRGGYRPWQRASVHVAVAGCHTAQVTLTASLQRLP
jgi:hypothetical protein